MPQIVNGANFNSAANALAGTVTNPPATVDCPANTRLLGGGARVTITSGTTPQRVALQSSRPADIDTWQATGVVLVTLTGGQMMQVQPYAICTTP